MAPKPALKPFTVDTVSLYARHHLKLICPDLFQDDFSSDISIPKVITQPFPVSLQLADPGRTT